MLREVKEAGQRVRWAVVKEEKEAGTGQGKAGHRRYSIQATPTYLNPAMAYLEPDAFC